MTSSSTLTELAGRCERSTTRDRQLGAEIICHVKGYRFLAWGPCGTDLSPHLINIAAETAEGKFQFWAVDPTASLDAAMTLARTPQEAYQATVDAMSAIAKRDDLHCCFYRGSFTDDLARQVSANLIRARASMEADRG